MSSAHAGGTPAEPTKQPQAGTPSASAPPAGTDESQSSAAVAANGGSEQLSLEEAKKLRQEHNSLRKRVAEYEQATRDAELAKLSETEKLQKQYGDAQSRILEQELRIQQNELRLAGYALAPTLGIADIGLALAAVQSEHAHEIAFDDKTGTPTNLEALLKAVVKEHPGLAAQAQQSQQQQQQSPLQPGQYQRPPVQSGPPMSPGANAAPVTQPANRPLRTFNDVQWKI